MRTIFWQGGTLVVVTSCLVQPRIGSRINTMDSYVCLSVYLANSLDFASIYYLFYTPIGALVRRIHPWTGLFYIIKIK